MSNGRDRKKRDPGQSSPGQSDLKGIGSQKAEADLDDIFQEFLLRVDTPDAAALDAMVAEYPQYASQLTDFAVEWAIQDLVPGGAETEAQAEVFETDPAGNSLVAAAMDRLHAGLGAAKPVDPFKDRSAADLKRLGSNLGLDKTLVAKFRDRRIDAGSIPHTLQRGLAHELEVPLDAVIAHLQAPPILSMGASFKAQGKPEAVGKEPFAQAVERSQLADADKKRLLTLDDD